MEAYMEDDSVETSTMQADMEDDYANTKTLHVMSVGMEAHKAQGNLLFSRGKYKMAIHEYTQALTFETTTREVQNYRMSASGSVDRLDNTLDWDEPVSGMSRPTWEKIVHPPHPRAILFANRAAAKLYTER